MKVSTRLVLVLAMITALLAAVPRAGAQEPTNREGPPEDILPGEEPLSELTKDEVDVLIRSEMSVWLAVRESWGFGGDVNLVSKLVRSREGQLGMAAWSVPLSYDERAEMDERVRASSNPREVRAALERMDGYADMYIDERQGTVFVNFSTVLSPKDKQDIKSLFPVPSRVEFRAVKHSLQELEEVVQDLVRLHDGLPEVSSLAISPEKNAVLVGVHEAGVTAPSNPEVSAGFLEEIAGRVKAEIRKSGSPEYGDLDSKITIRVSPIPKPSGCYGRLNCGTTSTENWRGGTGLDTNQPSQWQGSSCTTGFVFTDGSARLLGSSGHCDRFSNRNVAVAGQDHTTAGTYDIFVSNSVVVDWPVLNGTDINNAVDSDAAMIAIHPDRSDNRVYKSYQKKNWFINARNDNLMVGAPTCVSGVITGWRCGNVLPFYASDVEFGPIIPNTSTLYFVENLHLVEMTFRMPGSVTTTEGNSGAPVFAGRAAHGMMFADGSFTAVGSPSNPDTDVTAFYSTIQGIEDELGVELCTAAADC